MAVIDSKKLLPPSKKGGSIEKQKFLVPIKNISTKKITGSDLKPVDKEKESSGSLVVVRKKIIKLSNLINNNLLIDQKERSTKRKEEERSKSEKREKDIEKKVKRNDVKFNLISSIPGGSIFDVINRFIGFTLLGYLFNKYAEYLPKLLELGKKLEPAVKFIEDFSKNILKGVIGFIEFGYKTYDSIHDSIKKIGGEGAAKTFDEFSKNLNLVLTGAVATAALALSTSPKGKVSPQGTVAGTQGALGKPKPGTAGRPKVTTSGGRGLGRPAIRNPLRQRPKISIAGGSKGIGRFAGKAFGRIPIIGGLVDFLFALWSGEPVGRAAAKAVGATIGSALGTFVPVPFAGTILGGILGDIVGGALYDTVAGQPKPQAKAQGGVVTRGGQSQVAPKRKIKTTRTKQVKRISPQKTQPGKDVGGKLKIEQLYGTDEPGKRSALRALKKSSEDVKKIKSLGGLPAAMFGAGIDMSLGQRPDKNLANSLGGIFGSVIQSAVDAELNSSFGDISRSLGMANGGVVPSREIGNKLSIGERVGKFISKALAISIESSAARILQNLNREMQLESGAAANEGGGGGGGGGGLDGIDQMSSLTGIHKQAADIIAGYESATSGGYNAMNRGEPGDSPEGPMHYFGKNLTDMTIGEVMGLQSQGRSKLNAAGRYQFVGNTLPTAMRDANLKPGDKFSPLNQDKMFVSHLIKNGHRPWTGSWGMGKYSRQQLEILDRAAKTPITGQTFSAAATTANMTGVSILETSQYGWRWGREHHGIDLQAASGWKDTIHLPVVVKRGGVVKYSGIKSKNMGMVEIQHPDGSFTRYLHLNGFKVRTGDSVRPGQIIGRLANLGESGIGNATGPHLHFEYYPPGANGPVNPKNIYPKYVSLGGTRVQPSSTTLSQLPAAPAKPTRQTPSSTSRGSGRPSLDLPGLGLKRNPRTGIWEKASLAPSQTSAVASLNKSGVLKEDTSTTIYNNNAVAILPIEVGMQA